MKKTTLKIRILSYLFFSTAIGMYSQDLIVTQKGDSLNCKITKIKEDYIYFTFKQENEIRSTLLPRKEVKKHQYTFYKTAIIPADFIASREKYPRFRFAIGGGLSYRVARISSAVQSDFVAYVKDLKSGGNFTIDASYYFSRGSGAGLKYTTFTSKGILDVGGIKSQKISDDISINYIGAFYGARFLNKNKKNCFLVNVGLGYMTYKNDTVVTEDTYTFTGDTLGVSFDIGYDIGITKNIALGFQVAYIAGNLSQVEITNNTTRTNETIYFENNEYESLAPLDFNVGFRFSN